jgi:hypothetical protein
MKLKIKMMLAAVGTAAVTVIADSPVYDWTLAADKTTGDLNVAANWRGGAAPANSGAYSTIDDWADALFYATNACNTVQAINLLPKPTSFFWALGSFKGDAYHWLYAQNGLKTDVGPLFEDASGFEGIFFLNADSGTSQPGQAAPILRVREGYTNYLPQLLVRSRPNLRVYGDNVGGVARVGRMFGRGSLFISDSSISTYKNQNSSYVFDQLQTGVQGHLFANAYAPVTLNGREYDEPHLPAGAALHLDASLSSTWTTNASGRVTEWRDADGGTVVATKCESTGNRHITLGTSTNGLAVMQLAGGAYFQLSRELQAKELFVVFRHAAGEFNVTSAEPPQFVGNSSGDGPFRRATTQKLNYTQFGLFGSKTSSSKELDAGETWYDGTRLFTSDFAANSVRVDAFYRHALHVVSAGLKAGSSPVEFLGARTASADVGRIHLAEVVIYEKSLTSAERREANAYLRRKWQTASAAADWDLATYSVRATTGGSERLTIGSGRVGIRELNYPAASTSIVKRGAGELTVEQITPAATPVRVEEGSLKIRTPDGEVKEEMAPNPYVWLDAAQADTLVPDPEDSTRVCKWWDPRPAGSADPSRGTFRTWATNAVDSNNLGGIYGMSPKKINDTPTGLTALDFGPTLTRLEWTNGTARALGASFMKVDGARLREGFVVVKANSTLFRIFGAGNWTIFDSKLTQLGNSSWVSPQVLGGFWTIDGSIVNPVSVSLSTGQYYVFGFRPNAMYEVPYLGAQRLSDGAGGNAYAEVIYYDRVLTPEERRNTEAYLMKKWLGKDHPDKINYATARRWSFGENSDNTIDTDRAMAVTGVETASGTLVKKGAGALALPLDQTAADGLDVQEGAVAATVSFSNLIASAALHLDASAADSLVTVTDEKGEQITRWNDAGGNGLYLVPCEESWSPNKPYLLTETVGGQTRQVVSIGETCSRGDKPTPAVGNPIATNGTATAFRIRREGAGDANQTISKIREYHFVIAEVPQSDTGSRSRLFTANNAYFARNGSNFGYILSDGDGRNDGFKYGSFYGYDGKEYSSRTSKDFGTGYHQGFYAVTNDAYGSWASLSFLGGGNNINSLPQIGGQKICEILVFTNLLSYAERTNVVSALRRKWLGADDAPDPAVNFGTVTVASGASFSLDGDIEVKLAGLAVNGGTVNAATPLDLSAQNSFTFDFASAEDYGRIATTDALTIKDGAVFNINVAAGVKLPSGVYPLITAQSIAGTPSARPVVTADRPYNMKIIATETTVDLQVLPRGMMIRVK